MRTSTRLLIAGVLSEMALFAASAQAAQPSKSIKECNAEYRSRADRLEQAHVTASRFFHECWWHSAPGQATALGGVADDHRQANASGGRAGAPTRVATSRHFRAATLHRSRLAARVGRKIRSRLARKGGSRWALAAAAERKRRDRIVRTRFSSARAYARGEDARRYEARWETGRALRRQPVSPIDREELTEARWLYARGRSGISDGSSQAGAIPVPPNARDGRRIWIKTTARVDARLRQAVLVGPSADGGARKGAALHCWDQSVLFTRDGGHWADSLVCDRQVAWGTQPIWFAGYEHGGQ